MDFILERGRIHAIIKFFAVFILFVIFYIHDFLGGEYGKFRREFTEVVR